MARIVFMGSPDFAVPSLRALVAAGHDLVGVVTQPDREAGRGRRLVPPAVKTVALELGLPVLQPPSLRRPEAVAQLAAPRPEAIVVAAFGQILRRAVLEIPPRGVLNVHASLLPRWRGASPVTAAILAGDAESGVSIMLVDEGLDTGPVLATRSTPITDADTGGTLTDRLAEIGAELLVETLPGRLDGTVKPKPQVEALATYAPRIEKDAGQIGWSQPAVDIWRQVRAFNPWPGAFTTYAETVLKLLDAWPLVGYSAEPPGTVLPLPWGARDVVPAERPRPAFAVVTGEGFLLPLKLQRAGKRAIFAEEFLHGERALIGSRLVGVIA
ncbi:MAG: methionyl-tRNA formyltransferase [Dehalococcoidia bacterium]